MTVKTRILTTSAAILFAGSAGADLSGRLAAAVPRPAAGEFADHESVVRTFYEAVFAGAFPAATS